MSGSPFPGMDPYLEGEMWQEFHDRLANQISAQLLPRLKPKYVALLNKRYVIATTARRVVYPDVHIAEPPQVEEVGELTYATVPPSAEVISPAIDDYPVLNIEIRDVAERRLVTVIEILSPVNKNGPGFEEYQTKRLALLATRTHLLEIDLLRQGERLPLIGEVPPAPYYVFLSRFTRRPITEVWALGLRERLPNVPVPLLPPDPDVTLSLQAAVDECFKLVGYERLLDYTPPPPPPELSAEDAAWARERTGGVREGS